MSKPTTLESFGEKPPIYTTVEDYQREMKDLQNARARLPILEREIAVAQKELSEAEKEFLRAREEYDAKWRRLRQVTRNMRYWQTRIATLTARYEGLRAIGWRYLRGTQRPEYQRLRGLLPAAHARLMYWTDEQTTIINEINAERPRFTYLKDVILGISETLRELRAEYNSVKANIATLEDQISRKVIEEWLGDEACLLPETLIWTSEGLMPIEECREETSIVSNDQTDFRTVTRHFRKVVDEWIYRLRPYYFYDLRLTKNHPIWVCEKVYRFCNKGYMGVEITEPQMLTVPMILKNTNSNHNFYIGFPIFSKTKDIAELTDERCELLGYYAAEGDIPSHPEGDRQVRYTLHERETEFAERIQHLVKQEFQANSSNKVVTDRRNGNHYRIVRVYSAKMVRFIKRYCTGTARKCNKQFGATILFLPPQKQLIIMSSAVKGNGTIRKNRRSCKYGSSSKKLILQMQWMLLRNGVLGGINQEADSGGFNVGNIFYNLCFPYPFNRPREPRYGFFKDGFVFVSLGRGKNLGISQERYCGSVHNLGVDGESYLTNSGLVHNCSGNDIWWNALNKQYVVRKPRVRDQLIGELVRREKKLGITYTACYDEQTEVLTLEGWKLFKDVRLTDHVATLTPSLKLEYQKPTKLFSSHYLGKMYKLTSRQIDLLVTPNHNLFVETRARKPKFRLLKPQEVFGRCVRHLKVPVFSGEEQAYFELPALREELTARHRKHPNGCNDGNSSLRMKMDDFLELLGYYLAEGSLRHPTRTSGGHGINFSEPDEGKRAKMMAVVKRIFPEVTITESPTDFFFHHKQLYYYLKQLGHATEKYIPKEFKNLCPRQLRILLNSLILGDGYPHSKSKNRYYVTSSQCLRDDVQEIALKAGFGSNYWPKKCHVAKIRGRIIHSGPAWEVSITNHSKTPTVYSKEKRGKESWVNYDGEIYCVEVPNHTLLVRRNGKTIFCGNSIETSEGHDVPLTVEITTVTLVREKDLAAIAEVERQLDRKTMDYMVQNAWANLMPSFEKKGIEFNGEHHILNIRLYPFKVPDYPTAHLLIERKSRYIPDRKYEADISLV